MALAGDSTKCRALSTMDFAFDRKWITALRVCIISMFLLQFWYLLKALFFCTEIGFRHSNWRIWINSPAIQTGAFGKFWKLQSLNVRTAGKERSSLAVVWPPIVWRRFFSKYNESKRYSWSSTLQKFAKFKTFEYNFPELNSPGEISVA